MANFRIQTTPDTILMAAAFLLSLLVTISAPHVKAFDAVRATWAFGPSASASAASTGIDQIRVSTNSFSKHRSDRPPLFTSVWDMGLLSACGTQEQVALP